MTALALVDHEGRVLVDHKPTTSSGELPVERPQSEPMHVVAAREAEKASTQKTTNKQSKF